MLSRLGEIISTVIDMFIDRAEDAIPPERRLANARKKRKELLGASLHDGAKIGEVAAELAQQRATMLVMRGNTYDDIAEEKRMALQAQQAGDADTEALHNANAVRLANELAEIDEEIKTLDLDVENANQDFKMARQMIVDFSRQIEREARGDVRIIGQIARTNLKGRMVEFKESILGLTTSEDPSVAMRQRLQNESAARERYIDAKDIIVEDLWQAHRGSRIAEGQRVSAAGRAILEQVNKEVGYEPKSALPEATPKAEAAEKTAAQN